ncbi:hypothetical protein ACFLUU_09355 [Chloroflexota bacterium]
MRIRDLLLRPSTLWAIATIVLTGVVIGVVLEVIAWEKVPEGLIITILIIGLIISLFLYWYGYKRYKLQKLGETNGEWLEATRNADPAVALKDLALKAAREAEGIKDEVEADSMKLTSMMLTSKAVEILKDRLQPTSEDIPLPVGYKPPRPPELQITYNSHKFDTDNGVPIVAVFASYRPDGLGEMKIEAIELHVIGKREPALGWKVAKVTQDLWVSPVVKFKIPDGISSGEHDVVLVGYANGTWWPSLPFSIDFP